MAGAAEFTIDERGLVVTLVTDELVFAGNSAVLEHKGAVILDAVVPPLARIDNQLQVDGHTNQLNVSTAPYPSGWELSSARASAVVRYLIEHGHLAADRLSAAGYSDQRPLLPPSDPRSITRNRRVDIVVLSKLPASARASLVALGASAGSGD
jgi:chemotaxis protein MotB